MDHKKTQVKIHIMQSEPGLQALFGLWDSRPGFIQKCTNNFAISTFNRKSVWYNKNKL